MSLMYCEGSYQITNTNTYLIPQFIDPDSQAFQNLQGDI